MDMNRWKMLLAVVLGVAGVACLAQFTQPEYAGLAVGVMLAFVGAGFSIGTIE